MKLHECKTLEQLFSLCYHSHHHISYFRRYRFYSINYEGNTYYVFSLFDDIKWIKLVDFEVAKLYFYCSILEIMNREEYPKLYDEIKGRLCLLAKKT